MKISARVDNQKGHHAISLRSGESVRSIDVAPKAEGFGSSVNGGEMLFLALATCYCNDIYREAKKRGITVESVEVEVSGEFGGEGEAARNINYRALVTANAPQQEILELMRQTDAVAEIQNTLRKGSPVVLAQCEAREV